jgi:hypothetical protein
MSRSIGIKRDLRLDKLETYANYYYLNFRSLNIINQVINKITKHKTQKKKIKSTSNINPHQILRFINPKHLNQNNYKNEYISMEQLIKHFKY